MRRPLIIALTIGMSAFARLARAQAPADLFQQGVRAYQRLEFDGAAALFRRTLDVGARDTGASPPRSRVIDYLAASFLFAGNRDSATGTFRRALVADPLHRVDELIFPPEVSGLFDEVRRTTKAVTLTAPAEAALRLGIGVWSVRLVATSFHDLSVTLTGGGGTARTLYSGPIGDSLTLYWDGRDTAGAVARPGTYALTIASRVGGQPVRVLRVPLAVEVTRRDTVPSPPRLADSLLLPERLGAGRATRSLLGGLWVGGAAAVMPIVMARGVKATPARFVVGGAVGLAGLAGFFAYRPGKPIRANIAANRALRNNWEAAALEVARENASRRVDIVVRIRLGTPAASGSGAT